MGWGCQCKVEFAQIAKSGANDGDIVSPQATTLVFSARLRGFDAGGLGSLTQGESVWLWLGAWDDTDLGDVIGEQGKHYVAKLMANRYEGATGDFRPLYIASQGEQTFLAQSSGAVAKGATGTFKLYHRGTEADSGITKQAKALGVAISANKWATVKRVMGGRWYAGCWET